jgi:N-acetylglucosamine kinase-like BadF-type ATPase
MGLSSIQELIGFTYSKKTNKRDIASLSKLLTPACAEHDPAAMNIADKCSTELSSLVKPVVDKLGMDKGEIALAGSILDNIQIIRKGLEQKIKINYPFLDCIKPRSDAANGAVLMALESLRESS